jgi:hypothetical protein
LLYHRIGKRRRRGYEKKDIKKSKDRNFVARSLKE